MTKYIIHWLTGEDEIVKGKSISQAFTNAGYSSGVTSAIDWYEEIGD